MRGTFTERIGLVLNKNVLRGVVLSLFLFGIGITAAQAETGEETTLNKLGSDASSANITSQPLNYFTSKTVTTSKGGELDQYIINGPPSPPPGYEFERSAVALPMANVAAGVATLSDVPAYNWVFGCSAVSAAMIAGYYDRNGYPDMYTGPTNGGVMPLNNSSWPEWTDSAGTTYPNLPLAATQQGVDGRTTRGSIDDYWGWYGSSAADPYITDGLVQHTWGEAIGDFMKTSQSAYGNTDGSTIFYTWYSSTEKLTCADMVLYGIDAIDGTYGRKLFYEARGYTVTDCYNQKTDNNGGGFTFTDYMVEIDAGRPVMLNVEGHTMVGIGYEDTNQTVYLHDTWDYSTHTMTWGGSYLGMELLSVSIVNMSITSSPVTPTDGTTTSRPLPVSVYYLLLELE